MSTLKTSNQSESLLKPSIYLKIVKQKTNSKSNQLKSLKLLSHKKKSSTKQTKHGCKYIKKQRKHSLKHKVQQHISESRNLSNLSMLLIESKTNIEDTYLTLEEQNLFASLIQRIDDSVNTADITPFSSAKLTKVCKDKLLTKMVLDTLNSISTSTEENETDTTSVKDSILNPNEWWISQDYYNDT
eukprot:463276_1